MKIGDCHQFLWFIHLQRHDLSGGYYTKIGFLKHIQHISQPPPSGSGILENFLFYPIPKLMYTTDLRKTAGRLEGKGKGPGTFSKSQVSKLCELSWLCKNGNGSNKTWLPWELNLKLFSAISILPKLKVRSCSLMSSNVQS